MSHFLFHDANSKKIMDEKISEFKNEIEEVVNEEVIVFSVNGNINNGLQDATITLPFSCKVKKITISVLTRNNEVIDINLKKTTDYILWENVSDEVIRLQYNQNFIDFSPSSDINLNKGDIIGLLVDGSTIGNKNMNVNLIVSRT